MKAFTSSIQYKVLAFGGAGAQIIKALQKGGLPDERLHYFDTNKNDIGINGIANRFLLGQNEVKGKGTNGDAAVGRRIFQDNMELFNRLADDDCLYVLTGALGGGTFSAMASLMAEILEAKKRKMVFVTKMPDGEGSTYLGTAFQSLEAINEYTDKVLLYHGELVESYLRSAGKDEGYRQINGRIAGAIKELLTKPGIRIIPSSTPYDIRLHDYFERVKAYVDGHEWYVAHDDHKIFLARTNVALLDIIYNGHIHLNVVSPRKFEELTASIYEGSGYETELTKATRDKGVDIRVKTLPALQGTPFLTVVQAKHKMKGNIQSFEVQQLEGARKGAGAERAAFVSTVGYSRDSIEYANGQKIDLLRFFDLLDAYKQLTKEMIYSGNEVQIGKISNP
jgi:hypothetical protein